jgi:hypothetical protein
MSGELTRFHSGVNIVDRSLYDLKQRRLLTLAVSATERRAQHYSGQQNGGNARPTHFEEPSHLNCPPSFNILSGI